MKTTLTIDSSTDKKLRQLAYKSRKSYKDVVIATLHRGLEVDPPGKKVLTVKPYKMKTVSMGAVNPGYNLDKALQLAGDLEDEEVVRKMGSDK